MELEHIPGISGNKWAFVTIFYHKKTAKVAHVDCSSKTTRLSVRKEPVLQFYLEKFKKLEIQNWEN